MVALSIVTLRPLGNDDLPHAYALSATAGWNQRLDDWRMLRRLAPEGSFAAVSDGRIVGTAIGIDYGTFGWIAMMLVEPSFRGHGIGRRLLEAAMSAVPSGLPIRLDATPLGRRLYEKYGFEDEATLTRYVGSTAALRATAARHAGEASARVRPLIPADLPFVLHQDPKVFGGDRGVLLEWLLRDGAGWSHVARDDGAPMTYCFGRAGRLFDQVGPVVAADERTAAALVDAALAGAMAGGAIGIDAFDSRRAFTTWLAARGFEAQRPLFRMCRPAGQRGSGLTAASQTPSVEFAILGPEFA
jgi:GNAT superfamily N-acetyltransferase